MTTIKKTICGLLVYDARKNHCVRSLEIIVPMEWDAQRILIEAQIRLTPKIQLFSDDPRLVKTYKLDADPVFADWTEPAEFALTP